MDPDQNNKIYSRFPKIYRQHTLSKEESSMYWGIRCGDGWFDLIWGLSEEIQEIANAQGFAIPEMTEIKQKLGRLLVRTNSKNSAIKEAINCTQAFAKYICESCGQSGELRLIDQLFSVRCDDHSHGAPPLKFEEDEQADILTAKLEYCDNLIDKAKLVGATDGYVSAQLLQRALLIKQHVAIELMSELEAELAKKPEF